MEGLLQRHFYLIFWPLVWIIYYSVTLPSFLELLRKTLYEIVAGGDFVHSREWSHRFARSTTMLIFLDFKRNRKTLSAKKTISASGFSKVMNMMIPTSWLKLFGVEINGQQCFTDGQQGLEFLISMTQHQQQQMAWILCWRSVVAEALFLFYYQAHSSPVFPYKS